LHTGDDTKRMLKESDDCSVVSFYF